ncbi:MAG: hypothetical protein COB23_02490 [Methylophaga sp.]|nr:MAG: hypothetical protein COB23_02490 [Methylophaga sp.]
MFLFLDKQVKYLLLIPILLTAILLILYQIFNYPKITEIDFYSVFSDGFASVCILSAIFALRKALKDRYMYLFLLPGFYLLFISLVTGTLNEIYEPPLLVTTLFEDMFQIVGYVLIIIGIYAWGKHNAKIICRLDDLARTDSLTHLLNRRSFIEKAQIEFKKNRRYQDQFSILMIDIDHFKSINDKYGHACGDRALKKFSDITSVQLRDTDTICRWGGEEFLVLIPENKPESSIAVAEKLRSHIENISIVNGKDVIHLTVSIGIAIIEANDHSLDDLIHRADLALLEAKKKGRNCVVLAPIVHRTLSSFRYALT